MASAERSIPTRCQAGNCLARPEVLIGFVSSRPQAVVLCRRHAEQTFEAYRATGKPGQIVLLPREDAAAARWYAEAVVQTVR